MTDKALEIVDLNKVYKKNQIKALDGINLEVSAGDFFGLLGPNGAGKSTIIGIVSSLVNKSTGSVKVFGYDLDGEPVKVKSCIGIVPQEFNAGFFDNLEDIVINQAGFYGIPYIEARDACHYYLHKLGLFEKRKSMFRALSGGMKRRLMIARGLVHSPKLLFLDEPTAGVDIELRRSMWQFLREINEQGTTIVLTTHYLEEAEQLCKNLAIINKGKIVKHGSTRELLSNLEVETIVLEVRNLFEVPIIAGFKINKLDDVSLEVKFKQGLDMSELLVGLQRAGIKVLSMNNKTNRLEELFMNVIES